MPNSIFGGLFGGQVGQAYSQTPSALQNAYNHHNQQMSQLGQMNNSQYAQQALYNQYASVLYGTPSTSYNPNFAGTQATTTTQNAKNLGFSL